jgi:hypothetical protein
LTATGRPADGLHDTDPGAIAADVGRAVDYQPVPTDGAAQAVSLIAELV